MYASPKASVITNKLCSKPFPPSRATRQGCPLSPLLFALAIEPLSIMLKSSQHFSGIYRKNIEHRVSLYADDLLLYIAEPVQCAPEIVNMLHRFGSFSGYKLSFSKRECFPVNNSALTIAETDLPFPLSRSGFKYLGINVTRTLSGLYDKNYIPLINNLKINLQKWRVLNLSLAGKIACVKMNILQRFLYLF